MQTEFETSLTLQVLLLHSQIDSTSLQAPAEVDAMPLIHIPRPVAQSGKHMEVFVMAAGVYEYGIESHRFSGQTVHIAVEAEIAVVGCRQFDIADTHTAGIENVVYQIAASAGQMQAERRQRSGEGVGIDEERFHLPGENVGGIREALCQSVDSAWAVESRGKVAVVEPQGGETVGRGEYSIHIVQHNSAAQPAIVCLIEPQGGSVATCRGVHSGTDCSVGLHGAGLGAERQGMQVDVATVDSGVPCVGVAIEIAGGIHGKVSIGSCRVYVKLRLPGM